MPLMTTGAGVYPVSGGGGGAATFTPKFADGQAIGFGSTTYTSPTVNLGTGTVIFFIGANGAGRIASITGVTIGGVTATNIVGATGANGGVWYANGVNVATGTVVITNSAAWADVVICGGLIVSTSTTPSASSFLANPSQADPQGFTSITVPSNGIGFAGIGMGVPGGLPLSWSGATRAAVMEGASTNFGVGGASTSTAGTFNPTVTSTGNAWNFSQPPAALVAWGP